MVLSTLSADKLTSNRAWRNNKSLMGDCNTKAFAIGWSILQGNLVETPERRVIAGLAIDIPTKLTLRSAAPVSLHARSRRPASPESNVSR